MLCCALGSAVERTAAPAAAGLCPSLPLRLLPCPSPPSLPLPPSPSLSALPLPPLQSVPVPAPASGGCASSLSWSCVARWPSGRHPVGLSAASLCTQPTCATSLTSWTLVEAGSVSASQLSPIQPTLVSDVGRGVELVAAGEPRERRASDTEPRVGRQGPDGREGRVV